MKKKLGGTTRNMGVARGNHRQIELMNEPNNFVVTLLIFVLLLLEIPSRGQGQMDQGKWLTVQTQGDLQNRHECGFVEVHGKFYLLGGRGIKPVDIYDPVLNQWSKGAKPPIEIHHFQAVAYNGLIYIIGAMTGKYPREQPLSKILIYDPNVDQWSYGDEIPAHRRRGSAGVVVYQDKAIILSGITDGHWGGHVAWIDEYDFDRGRWKELQDAPRARDHFHAVINKGVIYCAGGRNSSAKTDQTFELTIAEVDVYEVATDTWISLPPAQNLPTERAGTTAAFFDDHLIVTGGESSRQKTAHNEVEAYNVNSRKWKTMDTLNVARHGTQMLIYKNAWYIASGSGNRGGKPELSSLEKYVITK